MIKSHANQPTLSIVIPIYREGSHLEVLLSRIMDILVPTKESFELILVDDGSPDNTWKIIEKESKKYPMLRALKLSRNFGKESAISAGLKVANGNAVVVMDGDLQHPPELIPEMLKLWRGSKADVIEAVKVKRSKESFFNKIGARLFYASLKRLSGYDLTNLTDFKLMDSRVVKAWLQMGERNLFFRGMSAWLGFEHLKIPFEVPGRASGKSTMSISRLVRLALTAITSFSSLPLHLVTIAGVMFFLFSIFLAAQTIYMKLSGFAVSGFTTVILLQLIIGSLLMITLGIVGEYIARIYEEVKRRPRYVIAQTIDRNYNISKNT